MLIELGDTFALFVCLFASCGFGGRKSCGATPKTGVAWSRITQNQTKKQTNMRTLTN